MASCRSWSFDPSPRVCLCSIWKAHGYGYLNRGYMWLEQCHFFNHFPGKGNHTTTYKLGDGCLCCFNHIIWIHHQHFGYTMATSMANSDLFVRTFFCLFARRFLPKGRLPDFRSLQGINNWENSQVDIKVQLKAMLVLKFEEFFFSKK